jgi:adenylate cyclase
MAGLTIGLFAGDRPTAMGIIDRAIAVNPNSALAWNMRGWALSWQNQPVLAIEAHQQAIRLSPFDPLAYYFTSGLGFAHLAAGRYEEAIEWADRALQTQPRFVLAMRYRLVCLAHLGRTAEARDWLKRVLSLQPGLTVAAWKASWATAVFSPEILALYVDGLRKAGLPEE